MYSISVYIYRHTNQNVPFSHSFGRTQKYKEKDCWAIVSSIYKRSNPPPKKKKNIRQEWGPSGDFYHAWWKPSVPCVLPVSRGSTTTKINLMQNLYIFYICWTTILKDMCTYVYICISIYIYKHINIHLLYRYIYIDICPCSLSSW